MFYITGDTHGEVSRFIELHTRYQLTEKDTLIVAGDFGCIFGLGWRDEHKLDTLAELPYTILFLDGNHECFPQIFSYPEELWNGGRVHRIRSNILHLMRGQIYELEGCRSSPWAAVIPSIRCFVFPDAAGGQRKCPVMKNTTRHGQICRSTATRWV